LGSSDLRMEAFRAGRANRRMRRCLD
jgi:hypothetical protein